MQNEKIICRIIDSISMFMSYFVNFDKNLELNAVENSVDRIKKYKEMGSINDLKIQNGIMKVAIAVSGGIDSMSLLYGMILLRNRLDHSLNKVYGRPLSELANQPLIRDLNVNLKTKLEIDITCITVNHNLRSDSLKNANFVKNFCKKMNVKCEILNWNWKDFAKSSELADPEEFSDAGKQKKINQDIARNARYELIKRYCSKNGIRVLFLGHHLNDQIETFIMRLRRKSGLYGLGCMSMISWMNVEFEKNKHSIDSRVNSNIDSSISNIYIIRPFLQLKKHELKNFLISHNVNWYDDISNTYEKYERVRVRNEIKNERNAMVQDGEKSAMNDGARNKSLLLESSLLEDRIGSIVQKLSHRRFMAEIIAKKAFCLVRKIDFALSEKVLSRAMVVSLKNVGNIIDTSRYKNISWRVFAESIYYGLNELSESRSIDFESSDSGSSELFESSVQGNYCNNHLKSSFITRKNLNELVSFLKCGSHQECVKEIGKSGSVKSRSTFICKNLIWIRSGSSLFVFTKDVNNDFAKITDICQRLMCIKNKLSQSEIVNFWNICMKKHLFDYGGDYVKINTSFILVNNFFLDKNSEVFAHKLNDLILLHFSEKFFEIELCKASNKVDNLIKVNFLSLFLNFLLLNLIIEFILNKFFTKSDLSYIKEKFFKNTSFLYIFFK